MLCPHSVGELVLPSGATELQGHVVVLAFALPNPDDDAEAQQRQFNGFGAASRALTEPDPPAFSLGQADTEGLAAAFDHLARSVTLISTPSTPGGSALVRSVDIENGVPQQPLAGNPQNPAIAGKRAQMRSPALRES